MQIDGQTRYISWWQVSMLIVANKLSMLTTYAPIVTGAPATRDAWISAWLAAAVAFILSLTAYTLMMRFPNTSLFRITSIALGTWPGRAVNLATCGIFFYLATVAVRMFSELFLIAFFPSTPLTAIDLMIAALAGMTVLAGFEVIARTGEILAPLVFLATLLLIFLVMPNMDLTRLLPVFEFGPGPMLEQALTPIGVFAEAGWVLMLGMPFLKQPGHGLKALVLGTALSGFMVSLGAAALITVLGPHVIDLEVFPTLTATRMIFLAGFLTRLELLVVVMWMGAMQVKVSLLLYGASAALQASLGLRSYRYTLPPLAVAAVALAPTVFTDIPDLMDYFLPYRFLPSALPLQVGLPLLLLVVAWARGLRGGKAAKVGAHG